MNQDNVMCTKMRNDIEKYYPNAKFDMCFMIGNMRRIISSNSYIILVWIGNECCGRDEEGHYEPKTFVVQNESDFITVHHVIKTLIANDFEVQCHFNCLVDVVPLVNPTKYKDLDFVNVFQLKMKHHAALIDC